MDNSRDELLSSENPSFPVRYRVNAACFGFPGGDDLDDSAGWNSRVPLDFQYGLEHPVGLFNGDLGRRDNRDPPLHLTIDDKILSGELTNKFDDNPKIGILKIDRNEALVTDLFGYSMIREKESGQEDS